MLSIKNILTVTKKEINNYLNNPAAYIIAIVFLLLWEFMFFRNAFLVGEATMRGLFDWYPWLTLILIPALTMGTISKELDDGTLELVLTHPLKELELLLGKFLSSLAFVSMVILFVVPIGGAFSLFAPFDWGVLVGQLLGCLLFAAAMIALGIFVSSIFSSQIASLLVTAGSGFLLILTGTEFVTQLFPLAFSAIFERLSLYSHFTSVARGVIDVRDLVYFIAFIAVFLSFAFLQLVKRKFGNNKAKFKNIQVAVILLAGIFILITIIGNRISGRLDLTLGRQYSLSKTTVSTLTNLNDLVTITMYASDKVPPQYAPTLRDTKDLLTDYKNTARGNLMLKLVNPSKDEASAQEAQTKGIVPVRFNIISGNESFQSQTGYLGIVLSFAGKSEVIPFVQNTGDLEYQLTSAIKKLTTVDKKTIGFLTGHGEKTSTNGYSILAGELEKQFKVKDITLTAGTASTPKIPDEVSVLVIAGPTTQIDQPTRDAIKVFASTKGKGLLIMPDAQTVNIGQADIASVPNASSFADFLTDYGITLNSDIVYDTRYNQTVRITSGATAYLVPYIYWIKAFPSDNKSLITAHLDSVAMSWTSSLTLDTAKVANFGYTPYIVLQTSPYAGSSFAGANLNPDAPVASTALAQKILAVALDISAEDSKPLAKLMIFGNSTMFADNPLQSSPQNLSLALNTIAWLGQEASLGDIKIKGDTTNTLKFTNPLQPSLIKYGSLCFVFLSPALYGVMRLTVRRRLRNKVYKS